MSYEIRLSFQSDKTQEELAEAMQEVYDRNGVDGMCSIEPVPDKPGNFLACFHRETQDDCEFVATRAANVGGLTPASTMAAAIAQLHAELTVYDPPKALAPIVGALSHAVCTIDNFDELYQACLECAAGFKDYVMQFEKDVPAHAMRTIRAPAWAESDPDFLLRLAREVDSDEGCLLFEQVWENAGPTKLASVSQGSRVIDALCDVNLSDETIFENVTSLNDAPDVIRGCAAMLRESAKQLRLHGDTGHAAMADTHADAAQRVAETFSSPDEARYRQFAEQIARMFKDREIVDGKVFDLTNDDAVDTLHGLIEKARGLTGIPAPMSEGDDDEDREETSSVPGMGS